VLAYVLVVLMGAYGLWSVRAETSAREEQACDTALHTRAEQEQLLVDMVTQLGGRQQAIDTIHQAYDELPLPASCEP
jgi:hypothetical protein